MSLRFLTYRVGAPARVSLSAAGGEVAQQSRNARFTADGAAIVFETLARLAADDNNGAFDIYRRDLLTGATTLLSRSALGEPGSGASMAFRYGPDGAILFDSAGVNLIISGDLNQARDVFVRNAAGEVALVSQTAAGVLGNGDSFAGQFSPDGASVLFESIATNLTGADTNGARDLFLKTLATGALVRVSVSAAGVQANGQSGGASFSADGGRILFESNASNLVTGDTNGGYDLFLRDLATGVVTRVSTTAAGAQANGHSFRASFTPDGQSILFESEASNLVANDTNGARDIFLKHLATGVVTRVSTGPGDVQLNGASQNASAAGGRVVFESDAANAVPGDTNSRRDIFVHDLATGQLLRISAGPGGAEPDADAWNARLSADGTRVLYESAATNLVPGDANGARDLFLAAIDQGLPQARLTEDAPATGAFFFEGGAAFASATATASADALGALHLALVQDSGQAAPGELRWTYVQSAAIQALPQGAVRTEQHRVAITDAAGDTAEITLDLTITGANDAPVAADHMVRLFAGSTRDVTALIRAHVADADAGDSFTIVAAGAPATGGVSFDPLTGLVRYHAETAAILTLAAGVTLADSFTYTVRDAAGATATGVVTVTVDGTLNDFPGADENDMLHAYSNVDARIYGYGGDDVLTGGAAHDLLDGGPGRDSMAGGTGNDLYLVDDPADLVTEAFLQGFDTVRTALAAYRLPDDVEDLEYSGAAAFDGTGNDGGNRLHGGPAADRLSGLLGGDQLFGRGGTDRLDGGAGDDRLDGGAGADTLAGGKGADVFVLAKGEIAGDVIADFSAADGDRLLLDGWSPDTAFAHDPVTGTATLSDPVDGRLEIFTLLGDPGAASFFG